jgi:hypothetical protein
MGVLNAEESVWQAMLDGWRAQQLSRNLSEGWFISAVRFADSYSWSWNVAVVEEFFLELCRRWCCAPRSSDSRMR